VLGPPLATASGRIGNVERATLVLAEAVRPADPGAFPALEPGAAGG
jgi:hypothetical protein